MCPLLPPDKDWIDLLSALLTPVIAGFGMYIAYQQRAINQNRLKHELFEKRYNIYESITSHLAAVLTQGRVPTGEDYKFLRDTKASALLFDSSIKEYTDEIYRKGIKLNLLKDTLEPLQGDVRKENLDKQEILFEWFKNELNTVEERFIDFIKLEH